VTSPPSLTLPSWEEGRCEKIVLFPFRVIPAEAGIQCFIILPINWTPVFTGVRAEIQFLHSFKRGWGVKQISSFVLVNYIIISVSYMNSP